MLLDINGFFHGKEKDIVTELLIELCDESFSGCSIAQPVRVKLSVSFSGGSLLISFEATALLEAECARCLIPLKQELVLTRCFAFKKDELLCAEPELPLTPDFKLSVKELVYTELVLEVPTAILCSESCEGLCQVCGAKKGTCSCKPQRVVDERFAVLENLLS